MEDYSHVSQNDIRECILKVGRYVSKEKTQKYLDLLANNQLIKLCKTLIKEYYDPLYKISGSKHEYKLSIIYENIDDCTEQLANYIKKMEENS